MIGVNIIATNGYFVLGLRLVQDLNRFYKGVTPIVIYFYSDVNINNYITADNIKYFYTKHDSWVNATNSKFKNVLNCKEDYIIYIDADTLINKEFDDSLFLHESIGVRHWTVDLPLPYDRNIESCAYISHDTELKQIYYQGAFFGGSFEFMQYFCNKCINMQKVDYPYEPAVNDESYINKLYHITPPVKTIELIDFPFSPSDKGGLHDLLRDCNNGLSYLKDILIKNKNREFKIEKGNLIFI